MKQIFLIATLINILSIVVVVFIFILPKAQENTPKTQEDTSKTQEDTLDKVAQRTKIQNHCGPWQLEEDIDFPARNKTTLTTALLDLDKYFIPYIFTSSWWWS